MYEYRMSDRRRLRHVGSSPRCATIAASLIGASFVHLSEEAGGWRKPVIQAAPAALAMYLAVRLQLRHRSVTCDMGAGGYCPGSRSMGPEHEGQLSGPPDRSLLMR